MPQKIKDCRDNFEFALECVNVYSRATGLGCSALNGDGAILHESGLGCGSCGICDAIQKKRPKSFNLDWKYVKISDR